MHFNRNLIDDLITALLNAVIKNACQLTEVLNTGGNSEATAKENDARAPIFIRLVSASDSAGNP